MGGLRKSEKPENLHTDEWNFVQLPNGEFKAIVREEREKNYLFSYSKDLKTWTIPKKEDIGLNGTSSKPVFKKFGNNYLLGLNKPDRTKYHLYYSTDGEKFTEFYTFDYFGTFQYAFIEQDENGKFYIAATRGSCSDVESLDRCKEKILFGDAFIQEIDGELYINEKELLS